MRTLARILVALTIAFVVVVIGSSVAVATTVAATGMVTVQVDSDDPGTPDLWIPMPALVLDLGLGIAEIAMPADERAALRAEMAEVTPYLRTLGRELIAMPDATLVSVESDREQVSIVKRGRNFHIDVQDDDGTSVRVSVPARSIGSLARFLD